MDCLFPHAACGETATFAAAIATSRLGELILPIFPR
jgi:hypothetical protein